MLSFLTLLYPSHYDKGKRTHTWFMRNEMKKVGSQKIWKFNFTKENNISNLINKKTKRKMLAGENEKRKIEDNKKRIFSLWLHGSLFVIIGIEFFISHQILIMLI